MCGACGDRATSDWARPWLADLAAKSAIAQALQRLLPRSGTRVSSHSGGWTATGPTGRTTACRGLSELVAAVRPPHGPPPPRTSSPAGRLTIPPPDHRQGVVLRIDPRAPVTALEVGRESVTVPDDPAAAHVLTVLASLPWSLRCYLETVVGAEAEWASACHTISGPAADLVVWLEWARQAGEFDQTPVAARCALDDQREIDVEIRAGHVVRARTRLTS